MGSLSNSGHSNDKGKKERQDDPAKRVSAASGRRTVEFVCGGHGSDGTRYEIGDIADLPEKDYKAFKKLGAIIDGDR